MINAIPVIGWLISFVLATLLSMPFWFIWTYLGIGAMFDFLPVSLQSPGFWATVGVFMCLSIFKAVALPSGTAARSDKDD